MFKAIDLEKTPPGTCYPGRIKSLGNNYESKLFLHPVRRGFFSRLLCFPGNLGYFLLYRFRGSFLCCFLCGLFSCFFGFCRNSFFLLKPFLTAFFATLYSSATASATVAVASAICEPILLIISPACSVIFNDFFCIIQNTIIYGNCLNFD